MEKQLQPHGEAATRRTAPQKIPTPFESRETVTVRSQNARPRLRSSDGGRTNGPRPIPVTSPIKSRTTQKKNPTEKSRPLSPIRSDGSLVVAAGEPGVWAAGRVRAAAQPRCQQRADVARRVPDASPVHRHSRSGSLGGAGSASTVGRRGAGAAAAARNSAAQRLARVMGGGGGGDAGSGSDDEDYELSGPPIELSITPRRPGNRSPSPSLNTLQMENDSMYDKLQLEDDRCDEADVKSMNKERQASVIGDAIEREVNLISRRAAALEQRKASMRIASRRVNSASCDEITALRSEAKVASELVTSVSQRVKGAGSELRSLHATSNRMMLSQEEMEEVVLKRCWLARYWKLSVRLGIHSDIAEQKLEHWSSVAPLALEVVLSIGQKARDGTLSGPKQIPPPSCVALHSPSLLHYAMTAGPPLPSSPASTCSGTQRWQCAVGLAAAAAACLAPLAVLLAVLVLTPSLVLQPHHVVP
ncbi:hypothetical protein ACQ4PT_029539 [Festuca glaucescens]